MRNNEATEYPLEFHPYLDGPAFYFFYEKFTIADSLKPDVVYFNVVKEDIL